jgi:hypothetical protein
MKALSEAVECNVTLQDLGMLSTCIITPQQQQQLQQQQRYKELIEFYLDCNWAGRKVYQEGKYNNDGFHHDDISRYDHQAAVVPLGLWPLLLERINLLQIRRSKNRRYQHDRPGQKESILFTFLQANHPTLVPNDINRSK